MKIAPRISIQAKMPAFGSFVAVPGNESIMYGVAMEARSPGSVPLFLSIAGHGSDRPTIMRSFSSYRPWIQIVDPCISFDFSDIRHGYADRAPASALFMSADDYVVRAYADQFDHYLVSLISGALISIETHNAYWLEKWRVEVAGFNGSPDRVFSVGD